MQEKSSWPVERGRCFKPSKAFNAFEAKTNETFLYSYVFLRKMVIIKLIGRISKGSRMDQVYLPKSRLGLAVGEYVIVQPLEREPGEGNKKNRTGRYFYGIKHLEPVKLEIAEKVFSLLERKIGRYENIIITGSFLDKGFSFNDLDILLVSEEKANLEWLKRELEKLTGIKIHLIQLSRADLIEGLTRDPLYQLMLSQCLARKRMIYRINHVMDYKLLDLQLLQSKLLPENFDALGGKEKYYLTRNLAAVRAYLQTGNTKKEEVETLIKRQFLLSDISRIKENLLSKKEFLTEYKKLYNQTFKLILGGIKNAAK